MLHFTKKMKATWLDAKALEVHEGEAATDTFAEDEEINMIDMTSRKYHNLVERRLSWPIGPM